MEKEKWKKKIVKACKNVGTYKKDFEPVIDTLSAILETRDKTYEQFILSGGNSVITHINRGDHENYVKNPLLTAWNDLNTQALTYWRDLGLTPSGLRKLSADALQPKKESKLSVLLNGMDLEAVDG